MANEVLYCKVGHEWGRPKMRGRKPEYCPDHLWVKLGLPDPQQTSPEPSERIEEPPAERPEPLELARAAKAEKAVKRASSMDDKVERILQSNRVGDETKRKLRYCQQELSRGREDTASVTETRRVLVLQAERLII